MEQEGAQDGLPSHIGLLRFLCDGLEEVIEALLDGARPILAQVGQDLVDQGQLFEGDLRLEPRETFA